MPENLPDRILPLDLTRDAASQLNSLLGSAMVAIFGCCGSYFDGRIKSTVKTGDHILIVKQDGTILLHAPEGSKPVHWQLAGAGTIAFVTDSSGRLELRTRRRTEETMTISFDKVYSAMAFYAHSSTLVESLGTEADFRDFLIANPDRIEPGLRILSWEHETPYGFVDVVAEDSTGYRVIIEIKRTSAVIADAQQLVRYREHFLQLDTGRRLRAVLVASAIPRRVAGYLQDHKLEGVVIPWQEIFPVRDKRTRASLKDFFFAEEEE